MAYRAVHVYYLLDDCFKFACASLFDVFLTDEVELEQSCQERRLVWSVKIRHVQLTRCVFRYGPRDGMTYSAVLKPID